MLIPVKPWSLAPYLTDYYHKCDSAYFSVCAENESSQVAEPWLIYIWILDPKNSTSAEHMAVKTKHCGHSEGNSKAHDNLSKRESKQKWGSTKKKEINPEELVTNMQSN